MLPVNAKILSSKKQALNKCSKRASLNVKQRNKNNNCYQHSIQNFFVSESNKPILVLDLDQTLVFTSGNFFRGAERKISLDGGSFYLKKRPHLDDFLKEAKMHCQLVLFTAAAKSYADIVVSTFEDPENPIFTKKFYRESCTIIDDNYIKDLAKISPDLSRILLIDDCKISYRLQPDNGIEVPAFDNNTENDDCLSALLPYIKQLPKLKDVREASKQLPKLINFNSTESHNHQ